MGVRFVHTADWQLGMRRAFLDDDAQARFSQARIDAISSVGALATERDASFVVVAGDVFDSNQVDRRTVHRALERLAAVEVPVLLLPGNHDPLDAASVYTSVSFLGRCPDNVEVLDDTSARTVVDGVEVVGVPWTVNEMLTDAVAGVLADLEPASDTTRVVVAHGAVDAMAVDRHAPGVIGTAAVEDALARGRLHYLALGDRHSTTRVGRSGRIWYAGAPEPTRFSEIAAGNALVVDLSPVSCDVDPVAIGTWRFRSRESELLDHADVAGLAEWLEDCDDAARTIVRLRLSGMVSLGVLSELTDVLEDAGTRLACLDVQGLHRDLVGVADPDDVADLDGGPLTRSTLDALTERATSGADGADVAAQALALLHRIARRAA